MDSFRTAITRRQVCCCYCSDQNVLYGCQYWQRNRDFIGSMSHSAIQIIRDPVETLACCILITIMYQRMQIELITGVQQQIDCAWVRQPSRVSLCQGAWLLLPLHQCSFFTKPFITLENLVVIFLIEVTGLQASQHMPLQHTSNALPMP